MPRQDIAKKICVLKKPVNPYLRGKSARIPDEASCLVTAQGCPGCPYIQILWAFYPYHAREPTKLFLAFLSLRMYSPELGGRKGDDQFLVKLLQVLQDWRTISIALHRPAQPCT